MATLSGTASVSIGFIRSRYKPDMERSEAVMLFLKESRSGPPLLPLVPHEKNQPDPGGPPRASWPFPYMQMEDKHESITRRCFSYGAGDSRSRAADRDATRRSQCGQARGDDGKSSDGHRTQ